MPFLFTTPLPVHTFQAYVSGPGGPAMGRDYTPYFNLAIWAFAAGFVSKKLGFKHPIFMGAGVVVVGFILGFVSMRE